MNAGMIDVLFDISGGTLPVDYPYELWEELLRLAPQIGTNEHTGIVPLRMAQSKEGMLLPKRAKLAIRIHPELEAGVTELAHKQLRVAGIEVRLGACKTRAIQHYPTLHAQLVTGSDDEVAFVTEVESALDAMGVKAKMICGQRHTLDGAKLSISGYSLVLHDLNPEDSLRVQYTGLGSERRFGCGIFVPYKVISGLE